MNCARSSSCCGSACCWLRRKTAICGTCCWARFSAFATLFRHALIALGDPTPRSKREAIQGLASRIELDASALLQLLDIREHKADRKQLDVRDVFTRYLAAVQQVTAAVDTMLDTSGPAQV